MTKMTVADAMRLASTSCDIWDFDGSPEGWALLINTKSQSSGFWALVDDIIETGVIEEAICISEAGWIYEGHHRLCAAILLGLDEIEVEHDGFPYNERRISAHRSVSFLPESWTFF